MNLGETGRKLDPWQAELQLWMGITFGYDTNDKKIIKLRDFYHWEWFSDAAIAEAPAAAEGIRNIRMRIERLVEPIRQYKPQLDKC